MRIAKTIALWILILSFTSSWAGAQGPPPSLEVFAEGGGSFLRNSAPPVYCPAICGPSGCVTCPPLSFSNAARLFTGARLRTGHDAVEASFSYSPNQLAQQYNRLEVISFNYVRYLWMRSKVQPFATVGLGTSRFSGPAGSSDGFRFAWNYGGGADIVLRRHVALRLELRDYVGGQPRFFIGTSHNIVPSAGIVFRLQ
jgi:hypothetical protein